MGKIKKRIFLWVPILLLFLVTNLVFSKEEGSKRPMKLQKTMGLDHKMIDVNQIASWISNDGILCSDPSTGQSGLFYPKGSPTDHAVIYTAGLWVVGKIAGDIRSAAADYATEFQPGMILGVGGAPDNPSDAKYKIFKFTAENWDSPEMAADRAEAIAQGMEDKLYGDQMLFCVYNDYEDHSGVWTKAPIGLEVQQLAFGFNRVGALGNTIFIKYTFINKGNDVLEDAYVAQFFDPDNGGSGDDAVGCDTTLGIGYVYNMDNYDDNYGAQVPSFGCDFFQGPVVPSVGDTAYLPGQDPIPDHKVLQMTSFGPYINSGPTGMGDPSLQTAQGAQMAYWFCSGLKGDGTFWLDPTQGDAVTKWPFYGDPVTGEGWIQENTWSGDDMRMSLASGPFTLEIGVPYSVVVGYIVGVGNNNLDSVTRMKSYDKSAQIAYDLNFEIPKPAAYPEMNIAELDRKIVFNWDNSAVNYTVEDKVDLDSLGNSSFYNFEGYKLYQGESAAGPWTLIQQWDKENGIKKIWDYEFDPNLGEFINTVVQKGDDTGLVFNFTVEKDYLNNVPLVNGRPYYFSLVTYSFNPIGIPKSLENAIQTITVIPQKPLLDTQLNAEIGQGIEVTHFGTGKLSDGDATVTVINPAQLTGHDYEVSFKLLTSGLDSGKFAWDIIDVTTNEVKLGDQLNQSGDEAYLVVDGLLVKVKGPSEIGINLSKIGPYHDGYYGYAMGCDWEGTRWFSWINFSLETFGGSVGNGYSFFGSTTAPDQYVDIELRFYQDESKWQNAYVYRRDKGYGFEGMGKFPGQLWDVTNNKQLNICFVEDDRLTPADNLWNMGWNPDSSKFLGDPSTGSREYLFLMASDYAESGAYGAGEPWSGDPLWGPASDVLYACGWKNRGTHPFLEDNSIFHIWASFINTPRDKFTFTTAGYNKQSGKEVAKKRLEEINVFPNPYFASNKAETDFFTQFVTFNNLPEACTIRIFSFSGQMVRTIQHDNGTPFETWDLNNEAGLPIASGIYFGLIEVPGVGEKILKIAIINREARYRHM